MNRLKAVGPPNQEIVADFTLICDPATGVPITSFGSVDDARFDAILARLEWVDFQNKPIQDMVVTPYLCANYDLLQGQTLEILVNPLRRALRIINASGNGAGLSQCDLLLGTKYVPSITKFNRSIAFGDDMLQDAPGLQHFIGCVPIGGQPLDGGFTIVEIF